LSFDVDNLSFMGLATILAAFYKIWATYFQASGHLALQYLALLCSDWNVMSQGK
jgi:hypothetical protein